MNDDDEIDKLKRLRADLARSTPSIHRCAELERTEEEAAEYLTPVPTAALSMSVTRLASDRGDEWILQLCGRRGELIALVRCCPFCGMQLSSAPRPRPRVVR